MSMPTVDMVVEKTAGPENEGDENADKWQQEYGSQLPGFMVENHELSTQPEFPRFLFFPYRNRKHCKNLTELIRLYP